MKRKAGKKPNWADPNTTAENEVLPAYLKWAWSSRGMSLSVNAILLMQLTYYCTDMLGLTAGLVGAMLLISKLLSGVTDLMVGFIIDKTNTRLGKARPYEVCIVFVWIFTVLMFSTPNFGTVGKVVYVFVLYTLINAVCATFLGSGETVYLARSIRSESNRVSVMSFNGGVVMFFSIIISMLLPQMIAGVGAAKGGWTVIACIIGIPMAVIGIFRFVFVKEVVTNAHADQEEHAENLVSLKQSISCILQNKYIWMLAGMSLVVQLISNIGSVVNTYYFKYIVGDIGLAALVSLGSILTPIFMLMFPMLSRKAGTVTVLKLGAIAGIMGYGIRTIGGTNLVTLVIGSLLGAVAVLPIGMMVSIYLIDTMDYGEWKTGIRVEGMLGSLNSIFSKAGSGLASGFVGVIMSAAGYDGMLATQGKTALMAIIVLFNYIPLVFMVVMLLLAVAYKLDKEMPKIKDELAARR